MNINLPNFNVKNLVKEAGSTLSRVVQLTEEKLGTTERTEYDNEFQNLAERADLTKAWTEKIVRDTETVLIPNPQNRIEDFIFDKIEKTKPQRLSNLEHLALDMIEAGGDFGQDLPYGQALIKVGQAEQKLGQCERDFIASSGICFTQPLRKFLEGEMKTITKERGILETKRLDLDACKNRVKKARSMLGQQAKDGISPEVVLEQAERDLRVAQAEFDRQAEITKVLLEGISTSQASHLRHLHAFVETQVRYYKHCIDAMNNLQRDLANLGGPTPYVPIDVYNDDDGSGNHSASSGIGLNAGVVGSGLGIGAAAGAGVGAGSGGRRRNPGDTTLTADQMKRARVLCAYDAKDHTELNLNANEVIFVTECSPVNPDYMYGKQGLLKGLVPRAFLEMLDDEENVSGEY
ncbi:PREDICTED: endophilin-B1 isoform X2 [Rhagoletis zephyria]|uniref:endophilin-B1 isoform X1 n=1 Tax=Rhagoletis zephyria TaxID=28612 RepID=UPI0008115BC2|nr:PREDICTED: endophilin-B1 isoform X1 [Rhagoletis zephyria]XP_017465304.1 PREDICTED: endophilin-B1 isoform X2 [Rhagoletis zephyria]